MISISNTNKPIKVIVFDLNGTITGRVSEHPAHIQFRDDYIRSKVGFLLPELPKSTTTALNICGLSVIDYYNYRNSHIDWNQFCKYNEGTFDILNNLKKKGYKLVLYSDCYWEQILATVKILKVDNIFDLILSKENGFAKPTPSAYLYIEEYFNVSPENILGVANDKVKDILPLKFIGGQTLLIQSEKEMYKVFSYVNGKNEELLISSSTI